MALGLVTPDGLRLEWVKTAGYPQLVHDRFAGGIPLDDLTAATEAVRTGQPVVIAAPAEYQRRYPDNARPDGADGGRGVDELAADFWGKPIGVLGMMWTRPQPLDAAQLAYISAVATMVGQALVRAQVYADEHARAAVLQAAVLPSEPADVADLDVAVTYEPADGEHGLGGDWYDVMALPKQRTYWRWATWWGHGLPAVEDMAQLRSAGRAMALQGLPPAQLLAELNTFTAHASHGRFATMAVAVFDPQAGALSYARPAIHRLCCVARATGKSCDSSTPTAPCSAHPRCHLHRGPGAARARRHPGHVHRRPDRGPRPGHRDRISKAQRLIEGWRSETALAEGAGNSPKRLPSPPRQDDVCVLIVRLRDAEAG